MKFAIDEIQNEFSSAVSKDFPETLLSEISMQRKQKITILSSTQVFTRVAALPASSSDAPERKCSIQNKSLFPFICLA